MSEQNYYGGGAVETTNFKPNPWESSTSIFILITILVLITIVFEICKDLLLEKSTKYTRPIYLQLFSEMTVLGFLSLITFLINYGNILNNISFEIFGEGADEYLPLLLEDIHYLIFFIMILTITQVFLLVQIGQYAMKNFETQNVYSQNDSHIQKMLSDYDSHPEFTFTEWILDYLTQPFTAWERHKKRFEMERLVLFYAIRKEFIRGRSSLPPFEELEKTKWLPQNFDFSTYLSICLSLLLVEIVEFTSYTWIFLWIVIVIFYFMMLACDGHWSVFGGLWLLAGYADLIFMYQIKSKSHHILIHLINPLYLQPFQDFDISRQTSHIVSQLHMTVESNPNDIPIDQGKFREDIENTNNLKDDSLTPYHQISQYFRKFFIYSTVSILRRTDRKMPLYTEIEKKKQFWLFNLLGNDTIPSRHHNLFWGGSNGPALHIFMLRVHYIFHAIYFTCVFIFFVPIYFENFPPILGIIYILLAIFPIFIQWYFLYYNLVVDLSIISNIAMLRQERIVQEVIRNQKASKTIKTFFMLTKLKIHRDKVSKKEIDLSNPLIKREVKEIIEMFNCYDTDHSGEIDKDELFKLLTTLGMSLTEAEQDAMFLRLDADGNGTISKDEYIQWYFTAFRQKNTAREFEEIVKEIFQAIDKDGSGEISAIEFQEFLSKMNAGLTVDEIIGIVNDFDEDGNGTISKEEFFKVIENATKSY